MLASPVGARSRWGAVAGAFALVLVTDQAGKWLAWRHVESAVINEGGFIALRPGVRAWFAAPTAGAIADAVGALLVVAGLVLLLRKPRHRSVLVGGALVAAGWTSNLLDRVGLHALTAPGSVRGVVDFIPSGGRSRANVADLWILLGVVLVVAARTIPAARLARSETRSSLSGCDSASSCSPATAASPPPAPPGRPSSGASTPSTFRNTRTSR